MMPHSRTTWMSGQQRLGHTRSVVKPTAEAKLLPPAGAQSDGGTCTDGFRPVVFRIDRIESEGN